MVKNETLMEEIKQLKHLLAASPDEKLQEIHRLREELKNLKHSCHHCEQENQSLSLETETLKQQLRATAEQCRALVIQLERKGATGDSKKQKEDVVEKERQRYESEIANLRNQLTEVVQANMKWQVYNSQRDAFVVTLQRQISNLKCQVDRSKQSPVGELNEDTQREIDKILISTKEKVNAIQEEKEALEDELRKFKLLCNQKEQRIAELEEQVRHLSSNASRAEDDITEMLKQQIRLCTEDFEAERRDRELAQSKISDLETQLELLKRQLDMYENSAATAMANQREAALINYKQKYYGNQTPYGLRSRGPSGETCWGRTVPDTGDLEEDCDVIDGPAATGSVSQKLDENLKQHELNQSEDPAISHSCDVGGVADERLDSEAELQLAIERSKQDVGGFGLRTEVSEGLRCPTCHKYFDAASHLDLLEHMDECSS
ncbi:TNFAIP3-interacting protein 2 isoform X2 [Lingula anatina]|uniref:TNFAIP3-interacting protein 2 isoform X2 n=1 Tax=Lingula anatina TaxID=7574 RepID=A0A1S3IVX5_LINAN|nr:TNFAIP3-interacting protein 2 isoform X2 [Lingula anatina]|eukprot:XP_013402111.1 TNFAIP3-interacting protein 2 isoform X2 [Lingula anatina]